MSTIVDARGIPMMGDMVRGILNGRKTRTWRELRWKSFKSSGDITDAIYRNSIASWQYNPASGVWWSYSPDKCATFGYIRCPYGEVGDLLWVREQFYLDMLPWANGGSLLDVPEDDRQEYREEHLYYRADGECCEQIPECACAEVGKTRWRQARFMPRWCSRITLRIKGIKIARINELSDEEAIAEGLQVHTSHLPKPEKYSGNGKDWHERPVTAFHDLIVSHGREDLWHTSAWGFAIEFERVK